MHYTDFEIGLLLEQHHESPKHYRSLLIRFWRPADEAPGAIPTDGLS